MAQKQEGMYFFERCRICGRHPDFFNRYLTRHGVFCCVRYKGVENGVEHEVRLIGKMVEDLIASWNELNAERKN